MKNPRCLYIATIAVGALSLAAFVFERLALMDIFRGEPDARLEWTVVGWALIPMAVFHVLGLASALAALGSGAGEAKGTKN